MTKNINGSKSNAQDKNAHNPHEHFRNLECIPFLLRQLLSLLMPFD